MSKTLLTRNQGHKITGLRGPLTTPGYKTQQQQAANACTQDLMRRGSFSTPKTSFTKDK